MAISETKLNMLVTYYPHGLNYKPSGNRKRTFDALVREGYITGDQGGYSLTQKGFDLAKAEVEDRAASKSKAALMLNEWDDPVSILKRMTKNLQRLRQQPISEDMGADMAAFVYELSQNKNIMSMIRHLEADTETA